MNSQSLPLSASGLVENETLTAVNVLMWRSYLIQRRRSLRTELAEIENILRQMAEQQQAVDKTPA